MEQLPIVMGGIVLAAVLWVVKTTSDNTRVIAVLQSTIEQNVIPEMARLRDNGHEFRTLIQDVTMSTELIDQRVTQHTRDISQLWSGIERRSGNERRSD